MLVQSGLDKILVIGGQGLRLLGQTVAGPVYLLRDLFTTNASAPLTTPHTCEPTGTLTLVQNDGQFSIVSSKLVFPGQATPVDGDLYLRSSSLARAVGRALLCTLRSTSSTASQIYPGPGWYITSAVLDGVREHGFNFGTGGGLRSVNGATSIAVDTWAANTDYLLATVLRSQGAFYFIQGGAYGTYILSWVDGARVSTPLFPAVGMWNAAGTLDDLRVTDLPAPFDTDFGIATDRKAGSQAAGTTFVHEANCLIEFTVTTMPTSADILLDFRRQDVNNCWQARVFSNGSFILNEIVAGVTTQRANTGAGFVSAGLRLVIIADGANIKCYINNVLRVTWATASTFQTMTAGVVRTIDVGGVVSNIVTWPRTLSGAALAALQAV